MTMPKISLTLEKDQYHNSPLQGNPATQRIHFHPILTREQNSFCAMPDLRKIDQKAPFWSRSSLKTRKHNENRLCSGSLQEVLNEPLIPVQHTSTHGCIQRESPQQRAGSLPARGLSSAAHQKSSPGWSHLVKKKFHCQAQDADTLNKACFTECSGLLTSTHSL